MRETHDLLTGDVVIEIQDDRNGMPVSRVQKVKESKKTNEWRPAKKDFIDCVRRRFQIQHYC